MMTTTGSAAMLMRLLDTVRCTHRLCVLVLFIFSSIMQNMLLCAFCPGRSRRGGRRGGRTPRSSSSSSSSAAAASATPSGSRTSNRLRGKTQKKYADEQDDEEMSDASPQVSYRLLSLLNVLSSIHDID
jgi:hypothetical protein